MRSLMLALLAGTWLMSASLAPASERTNDLESLRVLQAKAVRIIDETKHAFVFFESGSGFLISADGFVITNAHVIAEGAMNGRSEFPVRLTGGKGMVADLKGRDPVGDVALLKLRGASDLPHFEIGDADALEAGDPVVALGDPFLLASASMFFERPLPDFEPSASLGVVSAMHRNSDTYTDAIQVDAAVNRGNSGGPLVNIEGKVVGINGKIETRFETETNTGVGYAVPMSQVVRFLEPLKRAEGGIVRHGYLSGLDVAERGEGGAGLQVRKVKKDSPAEKAGFRAGDVVTAVDGLPVRLRSRFHGILGTYPAGAEVAFKVQRASETLELKTSLVERGQLPYLGLIAKSDEAMGGGARVAKVFPNSPAQRAGIQVDDVIVAFGDKNVPSQVELELALQARSAGDVVKVQLLREKKPVEVDVKIGGQIGLGGGKTK